MKIPFPQQFRAWTWTVSVTLLRYSIYKKTAEYYDTIIKEHSYKKEK